MQQIIIDSDFYTNPKQMKDLFVNLDFVKNDNILGGQICGMQYANQDMLKYIEHIIGVPQEMDAFEFVPGSGTFVINQENEPPAKNVCIQFPDPATQWVGVISLSEPEEPHFLKFYRNKKTGWDSIPNNPEELTKQNLFSMQHVNDFLDHENIDWENKWQETTKIELKFNQLILFRPALFHSYSDVFGDSKQSGRLLQFLFLKPKQQLPTETE